MKFLTLTLAFLLTFATAIFAEEVSHRGVNIYSQSNVSVLTASAVTVAAAQYNRRLFAIQNNGTDTVYLSFRGDATTTSGIKVASGAYYEMGLAPIYAVSAIAATTPGTIHVILGK